MHNNSIIHRAGTNKLPVLIIINNYYCFTKSKITVAKYDVDFFFKIYKNKIFLLLCNKFPFQKAANFVILALVQT